MKRNQPSSKSESRSSGDGVVLFLPGSISCVRIAFLVFLARREGDSHAVPPQLRCSVSSFSRSGRKARLFANVLTKSNASHYKPPDPQDPGKWTVTNSKKQERRSLFGSLSLPSLCRPSGDGGQRPRPPPSLRRRGACQSACTADLVGFSVCLWSVGQPDCVFIYTNLHGPMFTRRSPCMWQYMPGVILEFVRHFAMMAGSLRGQQT